MHFQHAHLDDGTARKNTRCQVDLRRLLSMQVNLAMVARDFNRRGYVSGNIPLLLC